MVGNALLDGGVKEGRAGSAAADGRSARARNSSYAYEMKVAAS